jgi:glycosyltransferase involved in cell wall biosynthesis
MRVAIAIPAYDAVHSVGSVVSRSRDVIRDVLVVDDGSRDHTADAARAAGAEVHSFEKNRGKGAALKAAFEILFTRGFAGVVTVDADGQHLPEEIPRLLAVEADLVLGTRERQFAEMSTLRRFSNRLSSSAISWAAGQPLADVQTGFRLYTRELVERTGFPESGFEAESAVVVRAVRRGLRVASTPIRLGKADGRGTSHYRPITDSLRIAAGVLHARFGRQQ